MVGFPSDRMRVSRGEKNRLRELPSRGEGAGGVRDELEGDQEDGGYEAVDAAHEGAEDERKRGEGQPTATVARRYGDGHEGSFG